MGTKIAVKITRVKNGHDMYYCTDYQGNALSGAKFQLTRVNQDNDNNLSGAGAYQSEIQTVDSSEGAVLQVGNSYTMASEADRINSFYIENEPGVALPSTGGPGITLLTILGSILVMLSGVGLILWRRRRFMA